jgi:hypothetical protein
MPSKIETSTSKQDKVVELVVESKPKPQEKPQEKSQPKALEKSQEKPQEKSQPKTLEKSQEKPQETSQPKPQAKPEPKPQVKPQAKPQKIKAAKPPKSSSSINFGQFFEQITAKLFAPKPGVNPAKPKLMVLLMPILIVVAVFIFGRNFIGGSDKNTTTQDSVFSPAIASAKREINWQRPAPYPETLRDPMQEYTIEVVDDNASVKGDIVIKGIVWSNDNPSVVIGSQILYVGEKVQGATITEITKEGVEFERDGKTWNQKVSGY